MGDADVCLKLVCYLFNHEFLHIDCLAESPHLHGLLCINKDIIFNPATAPNLKWGFSIYTLIIKGNKESNLSNLDCPNIRTKVSNFLRNTDKGQFCLT